MSSQSFDSTGLNGTTRCELPASRSKSSTYPNLPLGLGKSLPWHSEHLAEKMFRTAGAKFGAAPLVAVFDEPCIAPTPDGFDSPAADLLRETLQTAKPTTATTPTR